MHWIKMSRSTILMLESRAHGDAALHGFQKGIRDSDDPFYAEVQLSDQMIEEAIAQMLTRPARVKGDNDASEEEGAG